MDYFKSMQPEPKKCVALVAHGAKVQMRRVQGARFFIGQYMYNNRSINFLKHATFVAKRDVRLITGLDLDKKWLSEFRLRNLTMDITRWDFSLPAIRKAGRN